MLVVINMHKLLKGLCVLHVTASVTGCVSDVMETSLADFDQIALNMDVSPSNHFTVAFQSQTTDNCFTEAVEAGFLGSDLMTGPELSDGGLCRRSHFRLQKNREELLSALSSPTSFRIQQASPEAMFEAKIAPLVVRGDLTLELSASDGPDGTLVLYTPASESVVVPFDEPIWLRPVGHGEVVRGLLFNTGAGPEVYTLPESENDRSWRRILLSDLYAAPANVPSTLLLHYVFQYPNDEAPACEVTSELHRHLECLATSLHGRAELRIELGQ